MKKDIMIDLKRLGLHNGSEFISSAFLIKDNRLVSMIASYQRSGYINQALAVIPFKAYVNEPADSFKADIYWSI